MIQEENCYNANEKNKNRVKYLNFYFVTFVAASSEHGFLGNSPHTAPIGYGFLMYINLHIVMNLHNKFQATH